jgi:hypothetical protein
MSYGIQIINEDQNIIIDDTFSTLLEKSGGTASLLDSFPPAGTNENAGDIVFARPIFSSSESGQARVTITYSDYSGYQVFPFWGTQGNLSNPDNGYKYYVMSPSAVGAASSGFGLEIFKEDGVTLTFSSNISSNMEIVAAGVAGGYNGVTGSVAYNIPAGEDMNNYYVGLITNYYINIGPVGGEPTDVYAFNSFAYDWSGKTIYIQYEGNATYIIGKYIA